MIVTSRTATDDKKIVRQVCEIAAAQSIGGSTTQAQAGVDYSGSGRRKMCTSTPLNKFKIFLYNEEHVK